MPLFEHIVYRVCDVVLHLFLCELRVSLLRICYPHLDGRLHSLLLFAFLAKFLSVSAIYYVIFLRSECLHGIESIFRTRYEPVLIFTVVHIVLLLVARSYFKITYNVGLGFETVGKQSVGLFQAYLLFASFVPNFAGCVTHAAVKFPVHF